MKLRLSYLLFFAGMCCLTSVQATGVYDSTAITNDENTGKSYTSGSLTYTGQCNTMLLNIDDSSSSGGDNVVVYFNGVTGGYFNNGNNWANFTRDVVLTDTGLSINNGYSSQVTIFSGGLYGSGQFKRTGNGGAGQDFLFRGDMTHYSGNMNFSGSWGSNCNPVTESLGGGATSVIQFGGGNSSTTATTASIAQGVVSGVDGNRTIENVLGTGTITVDTILRLNYAADTTYDYLTVSNAISARYMTIGGTSNDASYQFTGNITGNNSTATNNTLEVKANTTFEGVVSNFGKIEVSQGTLTIANDNVSLSGNVVVSGGTLDAGNHILGNDTLTVKAGTLSNFDINTASESLKANGIVIDLQGTTKSAILNNVTGNLVAATDGGSLLKSGESLTVTGESALTLNDVTFTLDKDGNLFGNTASLFDLSDGSSSLTLTGTLTFDISSWGMMEDGTTGTIDFAKLTENLTLNVDDLTNIIIKQGDTVLDINWGESGYSDAGLAYAKNQLATTGKITFTIPEPSTATLSLLALAGLVARRRRQA